MTQLRTVLASLVLVAGIVVALAPSATAEPAATKSFTLALTENEKKDWEKQFNGLVGRSFARIECAAGTSLELSVGAGCVEAATVDICCERWTHALRCGESRWSHKALEGDRCRSEPRKKDQP